MANAMSHGYRHPLDIDLADLAGDLVDTAQKEALEDHLSGCLLCRIKMRRLRDALGGQQSASSTNQAETDNNRRANAELAAALPRISLPAISEQRPAPGQLWAAGAGKRLVVLVLREVEGRVLVAPATFDTLAADDETIVADVSLSPFGMSISLYPMLAVELPKSSLTACFGRLTEASEMSQLLAGTLPGTTHGDPIDGPSDPRLEFRQMLADELGALEEIAPDPDIAADAPPPGPERLASALAAQLRDLRGQPCKLYRLSSWADLAVARSRGWIPVATVDELGTVLIVLDTPSGLLTTDDFNAAIAVISRFNATAIVVLASPISPNAAIFNAGSLSYGIGVPSGQTSPPGPLLSGLAPADAIAKFLDQNSSLAESTWSSRASTTPSDVSDTLSRSAASAIEEVTDQGRRARIGPKVAAYTSIEGLDRDLADILRAALTGEPVAQHLSDLANRGEQ
jgi:hypothetical protein